MPKSVAVSLTGRSSLSTSAGARPLSRTFILASDSHSSTLTPGSPVHYLSAAYRYRRLANSAVRMSTTTHPGMERHRGSVRPASRNAARCC